MKPQQIPTGFQIGTRSLCLLLLMITASSQSLGQLINSKGFSRIPSSLRPRLVERLNSYFDYQQTKQYDMQFDLLTSECIQEYKLTKEGFIAANRKLDVEGSREVPVRLKV